MHDKDTSKRNAGAVLSLLKGAGHTKKHSGSRAEHPKLWQLCSVSLQSARLFSQNIFGENSPFLAVRVLENDSWILRTKAVLVYCATASKDDGLECRNVECFQSQGTKKVDDFLKKKKTLMIKHKQCIMVIFPLP